MSLSVKNLVKSFGDNIAVNNLSFSMETPGVFGLIGTNGAGKTTTIRTVLGIMSSDSGTAEWNGKKISRETLSFGYMPEERGIYMKTKVLEQLVYFGMLRGMNKTDAKNSTVGYMERLGVIEYKDMPAEKLSKGNQQKIQLISTLIHNPVLIFLDEPFSGLDPLNAIVLSGLIEELISEKRFIVMSSHQMNTVEEYCRDIIILHKGRTVLQGNLKQIKAGYGHTNLVVSRRDEILSAAEQTGLALIAKRADELEFKINGTVMANSFLKKLVDSDIFPAKFIIKEPSLNEIFIEKVGEQV
ncbi:MAG: ABC transporter ATP-binding protein [Firmicutes bacterium HGW-Firmicutes-21]|nr:MAG: ABC transporter ATP-binding protein [Firmicutes bacterium HGW-Firmicutes-21]